VLDVSGLQLTLNRSVSGHARREGVRQEVDFPPGLYGSFSPGMPVFTPVEE
jgi:hypothetical protein